MICDLVVMTASCIYLPEIPIVAGVASDLANAYSTVRNGAAAVRRRSAYCKSGLQSACASKSLARREVFDRGSLLLINSDYFDFGET